MSELYKRAKKILIMTHMSRNWFESPIVSDFELTSDPKIKSVSRKGDQSWYMKKCIRKECLFSEFIKISVCMSKDYNFLWDAYL